VSLLTKASDLEEVLAPSVKRNVKSPNLENGAETEKKIKKRKKMRLPRPGMGIGTEKRGDAK